MSQRTSPPTAGIAPQAKHGGTDSGVFRLNPSLLKRGMRFWLIEILISGFNFFVLMNLIYEPRVGYLAAHQIGMSTRIVYIFVVSFFLLRSVRQFAVKDLVHLGILWLGLTLLFEWGGSVLIHRPVEEILEGWNIMAGYMWPYVLAAYLFSNLAVGLLMIRGRRRTVTRDQQ